jgi:hypothetical protein
MSTPVRFEIVTQARDAAGWPGFVRAVAGRVTWKAIAIAALAMWALNQIQIVGTLFNAPIPPIPPIRQPKDFMWSVATINVCQAGFTLIAVLAADEAVERGGHRRRAYLVAVIGGGIVAAIAQYVIRWLFDWHVVTTADEFVLRIMQPAYMFFNQIILAALATFVYASLRNSRRAATRRHAAEIARLEARRRTLESKLQAMQARVEPQFLFNTLAQVRHLYESDAGKAGKMLDDLIAYLRAALPYLRESSSTIGKEGALASAYLDIVRIRLGERLSFDIKIPAALADARMPPMMLLPLIDHALVYGFEKSQSDGTVRIDCTVGDGKLRLTVTDSGAGFLPGGNEADLQDIRERLDALYGRDAQFRSERLDALGTRAILEIPYETADRSHR